MRACGLYNALPSLQLSTIREDMQSRIDELADKLKLTTQTAAVQLESMADELRLRREKQYELLDKLQRLEETAREQEASLADAGPQVRDLCA